ncbi:MAG: hypothetical protein K2Q33_05300 [Gammaproteobacteria bacterium]|nr:hypothetical protein [Gammaproteobacteria bacterium]
MAASGLQDILSSLEKGAILTSIDLGYSELNGEDLKKLAQVLKSNKDINEIRLNDNNLKDDVAINAIVMLLQLPNLSELNLCACSIDDTGTAAIANELKNNEKSMTINLAYNEISDEGAQAIATMLETRKTQIVIDLMGNNIGNEGATTMAKALQKNTEAEGMLRGGIDLEDNCIQSPRRIFENSSDDFKIFYPNQRCLRADPRASQNIAAVWGAKPSTDSKTPLSPDRTFTP